MNTGLLGNTVRQVAADEKLPGIPPLRPGREACPVCKDQGMVAGEASSERTTVYWCLTLSCPVRSFSNSYEGAG